MVMQRLLVAVAGRALRNTSKWPSVPSPGRRISYPDAERIHASTQLAEAERGVTTVAAPPIVSSGVQFPNGARRRSSRPQRPTPKKPLRRFALGFLK